MLVDRLWPVTFDYKGFKLTIDFVWGLGIDVPLGLRINLTGSLPGEFARLAEIKKNWDTYEEAVELGGRTARDWVDSLE